MVLVHCHPLCEASLEGTEHAFASRFREGLWGHVWSHGHRLLCLLLLSFVPELGVSPPCPSWCPSYVVFFPVLIFRVNLFSVILLGLSQMSLSESQSVPSHNISLSCSPCPAGFSLPLVCPLLLISSYSPQFASCFPSPVSLPSPNLSVFPWFLAVSGFMPN